MRFYYALIDDLGVLCVDQLDPEGAGPGNDGVWPMENVAQQAGTYPHVIYFGVDNTVPEFRVPVSGNHPAPGSADEGIAMIKALFEDPLYHDNPDDLIAQIVEVLSGIHPVLDD